MATSKRRVEGPVLADCPDEGGKWVIYCVHYDSAGEENDCGLLQDTNKRRLTSWKTDTLMWCWVCQETANNNRQLESSQGGTQP